MSFCGLSEKLLFGFLLFWFSVMCFLIMLVLRIIDVIVVVLLIVWLDSLVMILKCLVIFGIVVRL